MKRIKGFVSLLVVLVTVLFSLGTSHGTEWQIGNVDGLVVDDTTISATTTYPLGVTSWAIKYGSRTTNVYDPMWREWFWYRIGATDKEASFSTLTAAGVYSTDYTSATITFTDKQTPARFKAIVKFEVPDKAAFSYTSTVKKTVTIQNLISTELDYHLFSYSDLDISSGGTSDNVAIVKGERALQTGFDPASGAAVGHTLVQTSTLKPSAYSIDTLSANPGSIMESLDKSGPTQLSEDGGPNFETTDMQFAFQYDLKIPANGSVTFDITSKMVDTKPLNLTYSQAGASCASYGGNATFQLCADNTANTVAANNVVISQPLDPGAAGNNLTFAGATDGGSYDPATNSVNWTMPVLAAGATKCVQSTLTINSAVDFSTGAMVYSDETFPARYFKTDASGNPIKDINGVIDYNLLTGLCNYPPQITSIAPSTAVTGVPYRYQITASDAETDPLSYALVQAPAGMTMNATGLISWAPAYDQKNTSFPVTVDVSDGTSVIHYTFSIYVNWQNMVPTAPVMQTASAVVTQPLSYQVLASDPDNQPLTYTTADPLPAGLALSTTGLLSGTPTAAGLYVVNVKVTDTWNASVTAPVVVDIKTVVILPPTMTAIPNATITAPAPFSYQVVASDPQNQSLAYNLAGNPTGMTISATGLIGWTPSVAGTSTITATATNTSGVSTSRTFTLTVNPEIKPPTVTPIPKTTITAPAAFSYQVAATDPQGQALTYTLPVAPSGMAISGAGLITWSPSIAGNYNVTVRVTNTSGRYTDSSFTLTVNAAPQAPTMNAIPNAAVTAPAVFTYQVAASDPQNQPLSYTLAGNPAGMTITTSGLINWPTSVAGVYAITVTATNTSNLSASRTFTLTVATGNRPPSATAAGITTAEDTASAPVTPNVTDPDADDTHTFTIVTQPANGTVTVAANRLVYTPFDNFNGNDSFTYRATDAGGLSVVGTASVTVTPVNDAPVLAAIANQPLTEDTAKTVPLSATDADGDTISYSVTGGSAATVAASISGSTLTLTPAANYNTTTPVSFTVTANDGKGGTSSTTFTATVAAVNDVPVANGQSVTVTEDTARAIVLAGSDADNDPLTYAVVTQPTKGTLSGIAPNLTYTPSANATGADSFIFTVSDGTTTSTAATVSITITAVNDAPVALNGTLSATEDIVATGTLSATDTDNASRTYSIVTQGTKGTVTITNAATGAYTYTPATNQNGADSFTFKANDGSLDSNTATVTVTIAAVNDVPAATTQSVSTTRNTAKTITLAGTDVEGSALTYTIVSQPAHGTLAGIAPNLTYTPTTNYTGADSFTFTVSDGTATSTIATVNITVTFSNVAPVATPQSVTTNEDTARAITLAGTDSDNDPLTYAVVTQPTKGVLSGTAPNLTYTPSANITGADSFTFTVSDGTATSTAAVSITITAVNDAPVLAAIANQSLNEDTVKTVPLSATDADGDTVSYSVTGGSAATVAASISGSTLTLTPAADYNTTTPISFTVTASDGKGGSGSRSFTAAVVAVNDVPVAVGQSVSTNRNAAKAIVLTGSDVEGSALTYAIVSPPANGTLSGAAPNLTYTPAANYTGSDSFTFTVSDGTATSTAATVNITVIFSNVAPVATPQSVAVTEDTARAIVLAGTDADNDPLTYAVATQPAKGVLSGTAPNLTYTPNANATGTDSFTFTVSDGAATSAAVTVSITIAGVNDAPVAADGALNVDEDVAANGTLSATDVDSTNLTYSIVAQGTKGTVTITNAATGAYSYTPAANQSGSDSFTFRASDGTLTSNIATITISITAVNDAPVLAAIANQTLTEDTVKTVPLSATDADGDTVSYSVSGGSAATVAGSIAGNVLALTPAPNYTTAAPISFTVIANDGRGGTSSKSFTATVSAVNDVPAAIPQSVTTAEDTVRVIILSGTDPDGDSLTFTIAAQPTKGTLSGIAPNLTYTPNANATGADSFTFTVNDGTATSTAATVSITVTAVNDAPVVTNPGAQTSAEGATVSLPIAATDADGSTLSYSATGLPAGLSINSASGVISGTLGYAAAGSYNVTVTVTDGSAPVNVSFIWTVTDVDRAPTVTSPGNQSSAEGAAINLGITASDPDGTAVTYAATGLPTGLSISATTGTITGTIAFGAAASNDVIITVTSNGKSVSISFVWNITAKTTPVITWANPAAISYGTTLSATQLNATANVAGTFTYTPAAGTVLNAGTHTLSVTFTPTDTTLYTTATASISLTVSRAAAAVTLGGLSQTYSGTAKSATAATTPTGLTVNFTYDGSAAAPTAAGSYTVVATITDPNYTGSATGTMTIAKATPTVTWATPIPVTVGTTLSSNQLNAAANVAGTFVYTPAAGAILDTAGSQTLSAAFTPSDPANYNSATASVTLTVASTTNQAPVITSQAVTTAYKDGYYYYQVTASDPNGDAITYSMPTRPSGMTINSATGLVYWHPADTGTYSVTVKATDPSGLSASQSFRVSVVERPSNSSPQITSTPVKTAVVDTLYSYDVNATDSNGDTVYFRLASSPSGMTIDLTSGLITWTPTSSQTGSKYVSVEARDSKGGKTSQSFYIAISDSNSNNPPVITTPSSQTSAEGAAVSLQVVASDPDGDALTYGATGLPSGLAINSSTGVISGVLGYSAAGSYTVTVTAKDAAFTATATFTWTVNNQTVNREPVITSQAVTTAYRNGYYYYQVAASDPDGGAITYSLSTRPSGMTINSATGLIYWHPEDTGTYSVTVKATDPTGLSASQSFRISVVYSSSNSSPQITSSPVKTAVVDTLYSYDVNATDSNGETVYYRLTSSPSGMTIDLTSGLITWTPTSSQTGLKYVKIEAFDSKGGKTSQSFYVSVSSVTGSVSASSVNPCDVTGDGLITGDDMKMIIAGWGTDNLKLDIDGDGAVTKQDLLVCAMQAES